MKTQMKFQRWLCLSLIILGAAMIVYACLWKTGMLAALGTICDRPRAIPYESQAQIFFDSDPFNTALLWMGIASLLAACLLYVFANHKRRNYYITNYIVSIIVAVVNFVVALITMIFNGIYLGELAEIKADTAFLDLWRDYYLETYDSVSYSTSTGMFVLGYIICVLLVVGAVFLILNMLWKRRLMQGEKQLLERSFAQEVA